MAYCTATQASIVRAGAAMQLIKLFAGRSSGLWPRERLSIPVRPGPGSSIARFRTASLQRPDQRPRDIQRNENCACKGAYVHRPWTEPNYWGLPPACRPRATAPM